MGDVDFFSECLARLKVALGKAKDKEVAEALGLGEKALNARKSRGSFPEKELYALAAKRPDLRLDVDYVLTGITSAAHGLLDAAQARMERAGDAGVAPAQWQDSGCTPARLATLGAMLSTLRVVEFAAVFNLVESIVNLRKALEKTASDAPASGQAKGRQ